MNPIVKGRNICKEYQMGEVTVKALRGVEFDIYEKEFIVVLGPSGSGKSTLLNIIGGMDNVTSGEIFYKDQKFSDADDKKLTLFRRNSVGFVFQFFNLIPNLTAQENIMLSTEISKHPLNVNDVLGEVNLKDRATHFPSQLSGGEQQRVSIARAVAKNPDILLCDEPTGSLDMSTSVVILKMLKKFNKTHNKTVMVITHNANIAKIADKVYYIKDGLIEKVEANEKPIDPEEVNW